MPHFYTTIQAPWMVKAIGFIEFSLAALGILGLVAGGFILAVMLSGLPPDALFRLYGSSSKSTILLTRGGLLAMMALPPVLLLWVLPRFRAGREWARVVVLILSFSHMILGLSFFAVAGRSLITLVVAMIQGGVFASCLFSGELIAYFQMRRQMRSADYTRNMESPE